MSTWPSIHSGGSVEAVRVRSKTSSPTIQQAMHYSCSEALAPSTAPGDLEHPINFSKGLDDGSLNVSERITEDACSLAYPALHLSEASTLASTPSSASTDCCCSPTNLTTNNRWDETLQGCRVLLVLTGKRARWRVLSSIVQTGAQLVIYNPELNWATSYVPADRWIVGPTVDHEEALRRVRSHANGTTLDGVFSYDEFGVELAAYLAEQLCLPSTPSTVLARLRNKHEFRVSCRDAGLPGPRFMLLPGSFDAAAQARFHALGIGFPAVVKPVKGAGSCAVHRVDCIAELERCVQDYQARLPQLVHVWGLAGPEDPGCALLVESFLPGQEVDMDCVVHAGRIAFVSVSDNFPSPAGTLMESGGRCPSTLPAAAQEGLLRLMHGLVGMWGDQLSGVFHVEAMWTENMGAVPIEFNARLGGAETFTMVQTAWGVDLAREAVKVAVGELTPVPVAAYPLACVQSVNFLPAAWQGHGMLLRTVLGAELAADPALAAIELYHEAGACLALPPAGHVYMGWMVARGRDAKEADAAARWLEKQVFFEMGPCPE